MNKSITNKGRNYIGIRPSVGSALNYGFDRLKKNFLYLFLIVLVAIVVDMPTQFLNYDVERGWSHIPFFVGFFLFLYMLLFQPVIEYGIDLLFLHSARDQEIDFKEIINGFNNYVNIILVNILVFGLVGISFFLFIIPGIIVSVRLVFVSYLVMDEGMGPIEAVETSWKITRGHGWTILGLGLVSILIFILGFIALIVGILPAIMWIKSSFASLYLAITGEETPESEEVAGIA